MTKLKMALASFALIAFASFAIGQGSGLWPNWPIVSGSSYCASYTNAVCTQTIAAGPTALTGSETFPVNTGSTTTPYNALVKTASLNALPYTFSTLTTTYPVTAARISASSVSNGNIVISGGTITNLDVTLPQSPVQNQKYDLSSTVTVTNLHVSVYPGSGHSIGSAPTVLTPSTTGSFGYSYIYDSSTTKWYRLQ